MNMPNNQAKTIQGNPSFFSSYLNLATHNAFLLISDTTKKFGYDKPQDDTWGGLRKGNSLITALKNGAPKEKAEIMAFLNKRLPFLDWIAKPHQEGQHDSNQIKAFIKILATLWEYRNYLTHYLSTQPKFDKDILKYLRASYDASRRGISDRFGYTTVELEHLVRNNKEKKYENGIRLDKDGFFYSFYDSEYQTLSQNGIIYLTCLFLERRYSQLFLKQIRGFKNSTDREKQATIDIFSSYSIRLPRDTVVSSAPRSALLLDIFNELIKAPSNLYNNHLEENHKDKFRPVSNPQLDEDSPEETSLLVRRQNRFNFFALNYLDNLEILDNFRFQILYGRFYYHTYDSEIPRKLHKGLYAFSRMKNVIEFKEELKNENPNLFKDSKDIPKDYHHPYILDFAPRFPWKEDEFVLTEREKELKSVDIIKKIKNNQYARPSSHMADIILSAKELPALLFFVLLHKNGNVSGEIEINSILSKWKSGLGRFLKAIINNTLKPISKPPLENILRSPIASAKDIQTYQAEFNARKDLLNKKLAAYHLDTTMIPDKIRDYLMNISPADTTKKVVRILEQMILDSEAKVQKINKKIDFKEKQKAGQQGSRPILTGQLADFIAKDIVYFQKKIVGKKNDGKPNSDQFQAIQKSLAMWPHTKNDFLKLATQFNYFGNNSSHPFLEESIFNKNQFSYVYLSYLSAKIKYLKQLAHETPSGQLEFLRISTTNDVKTIAKRILYDHPFPIPKGWFLAECIQFIKEKHPEMSDDLDNIPHLSTPKLIQFWFERIYKDKNQPFYDFKRTYPIFDNWHDRRKRERDQKKKVFLDLHQREIFFKEVKAELKGTTKKQIEKGQTNKLIQDWRKQFKSYINNESKLKLQASQDILLYLMGLELFNKSSGGVSPSDFPKLKKFMPEKKIKDKVSSRSSQPLENSINEFSMQVNADKYSLTIKDTNVKMKDFGKFKKLAYDRRIKGLIPYLCPNDQTTHAEITFKKLGDELHLYQSKRLEVLEVIYEFEETMANSKKHKTYFENKLKDAIDSNISVPAVQHQPYLDKLDQYGFSNESKEALKAMRNAFSHNQYPRKVAIKHINPDHSAPIIYQIATFAIQQYQNAIEKIKMDPDNNPI